MGQACGIPSGSIFFVDLLHAAVLCCLFLAGACLGGSLEYPGLGRSVWHASVFITSELLSRCWSRVWAVSEPENTSTIAHGSCIRALDSLSGTSNRWIAFIMQV
jgi:hypothetical protein